MKKTLAAALILLLLLAGSLYNIHYLNGFTEDLTERIRQSQQLCEAGDYAQARASLQSALDFWLDAHLYTHIFIRHSEIDTVTDAFFEVMQGLGNEDAGTAAGSYAMLVHHIESIADMERIRLESVL